MKSNIFTILSIFSLFLISQSDAEQARIYIENYQISAIEYAEIMTAPTSNNNHTALRNKLLKRVRKNKATLLSNHMLTAANKERAVTETFKELIYPTEYDIPGEIPLNNKPQKPRDPFIKTRFETRNVGSSILLEITAINDLFIDLKMNLEYVKFVENITYAELNTPWTKLTINMPIFYTKRIGTNIQVEHGKFLHCHTYAPETNGKPDYSKVILTFIRADILRAEK